MQSFQLLSEHRCVENIHVSLRMHPHIWFTRLIPTSLGWWADVLPLRLVWISSFFQFIGGGSSVLASVVFAMLSELVPDTHR